MKLESSRVSKRKRSAKIKGDDRVAVSTVLIDYDAPTVAYQISCREVVKRQNTEYSFILLGLL
jgi:hypothetical protein